jgi:fluoroacetyl-CoA thioesterase
MAQDAPVGRDGEGGPERRRCDPGLSHERDLTVTREHTARSLGSGDVEALGTPALLALVEATCVGAIADALDPTETTVGTWAEVEHLRPSPVGTTVHARATLVGHHGTRLEFAVTVEQPGRETDDEGAPLAETVARVRHRRTRVERARFLAGLDVRRERSGGRDATGASVATDAPPSRTQAP